MSEHQTKGLTRRQAIAGGTVALAGLAVAAKTGQAQTETPQPPQTKLQEVSLVTPEELELWTLDLATSIAEGKSVANCLIFCGLRTKNDELRRDSDTILKITNLGVRLSGAMELNRAIFDRNHVTTVRYGEIYGVLDEALKKMLEHRFKINTE